MGYGAQRVVQGVQGAMRDGALQFVDRAGDYILGPFRGYRMDMPQPEPGPPPMEFADANQAVRGAEALADEAAVAA